MLNIIEVDMPMVLIHQPNEKNTSDILVFIVIYYSFIQQMNGTDEVFPTFSSHPSDERADPSTGRKKNRRHLVHSE